MHLRVRRQHSQFWQILTRFVDYYSLFGVPNRFPRLTNPEVRLRVGHQHSWVLSILIRFMHYYVPFLGPRVISTIDDPGGAFTCPSSTLTVLAKSDPFRGLLLTVLRARSDFHSC